MRKRRSASDESESHDRWLVSYADFITLMFAFFAVLYATSDINKEKSQEFQESIKKYLIQFGAAGGSGAEVNQGVKENSPIDQPIKTYQTDGANKTRETLEQTELFIEEILMKGKGKGLILDIAAIESGVRITLKASALFAQDSLKFRGEALEPLDALCSYLKGTGRKLVIESHTNKGPVPNSSFPSQWEFASGRATSFIRYLVRRYNYPSERLVAVSYGSERPLFSESDKANYPNNQRLEIVILTNDNLL
ncbi:MAG: OmpA family protein [Bdellovibrionales bacterium]|nr:OmpA family protein [Bdellovibrionales bacterium]